MTFADGKNIILYRQSSQGTGETKSLGGIDFLLVNFQMSQLWIIKKVQSLYYLEKRTCSLGVGSIHRPVQYLRT